jgi:hypothetical protein
MAKPILDIDINDEQLKRLEQNFNKFKESVGSTPRDFKNLTREFGSTAKVLSSITKDIGSWTADLRQATINMREFVKEAASASRSLGTGSGGGGGGISGARQRIARSAGLSADGRAIMWGMVGREASRTTAGIPIVGSAVSGATTGFEISAALGATGAARVAGVAAGAVGAVVGEIIKIHKDVAMTLLGRGDFMGINSLAGRMSDERRYTLGLGSARYGSRRAFENVYGRVVDPGNVLGAGMEAMTDPTSSAFLTYTMLGIDPSKGDPGEAQQRLTTRIREMARGTDMTMLGPALYKPYNLQAAGISMADLVRMKMMPEGEAMGLERDFTRRSKEGEISDDLLRKQQDYAQAVQWSSKMLDTGFVKVIGEKLTPQLTQMSDQLGRLVNQPGVLTKFADMITGTVSGVVNAEGRLIGGAGGPGPRPMGIEGIVSGRGGVVASGAGLESYGGIPGALQGDVAALMGMGYTKAQAAGIVANLMAESRGIHTQPQLGGGAGYGLAQWTDPARKADFARLFGHDITQSTRGEQLRFLDWEVRNRPQFASVLAAHTAEEAARAFMTGFERPADQSPAAIAGRQAYATEIRVKIENQTGASVAVSANQVTR